MSETSAAAATTDAATQRALARLRRYVEQESPSHDEARCSALAQMIAADLTELGAQVSLVPAPGMGQHVLARWPADREAPHLLVLGHLDTVHPVGTLEKQPFAILPDRVTGPGCFDMKAGVTLMIEAMASLRQESRRTTRPVHMLITCDEEVGSRTAQPLIEAEARGAFAVLVPEPSLPGGAAKTSRKGVMTYRMSVHGRAAHAGIEPERGASAITELAHQVLAVQALARPELGTTVNVTTVQGGTTTNVIPAQAVAAIDVRFAQAAEAARIDAGLRQLTPHDVHTRLEMERLESRPPLERRAGVIALYERARAMAATLGVELSEGSTGGGSDGCLTAALGIPTLDGLGPQGGGAHAIDEHVRVDDLPFRLALFTALLEQL